MGSIETNKIDSKVYLFSILTFFSIFAAAILHSNDAELFIALFGTLSQELIIQYSAFYDWIFYVAFIIGLIIGPISDKLSKRKAFILVGSLIFTISTIFILFSFNITILLIFRLFQGIGHILVWQLLMVLVYDVSSTGNTAKSISIHTIFMGAAMGLGTMFGGVFADLGVFIPHIISIISYSIVFIVSLILLKDPKHPYVRPTIKESVSLLRKKPEVIVPVTFNFVDRLHMGFLISIVPLYLTFIIPLRPSLRGMIFALSVIPMLIFSYPVGKKSDESWGRFKPLIFGSIAYGILLMFTGIFSGTSLVIFTIILLIQGCAQGFTTTPTNSLLKDLVEPEYSGMAVGLFNFMGNIGMILGPLFGLLFIFGTNYWLTFLFAGIVELASLILNYGYAKKMKINHL